MNARVFLVNAVSVNQMKVRKCDFYLVQETYHFYFSV